MPRFTYRIEGNDGTGRKWVHGGQLECEFHETFDAAMATAFYTMPADLECPHKIHSLLISRAEELEQIELDGDLELYQ